MVISISVLLFRAVLGFAHLFFAHTSMQIDHRHTPTPSGPRKYFELYFV